MTTGSFEAARAVNALMHLGCEDQQSLLEVLEDYFCAHGGDSVMKKMTVTKKKVTTVTYLQVQISITV